MAEKQVALITGITGQDGSYLAELLLEKGYKVYGLVRRGSTPKTERISHLLDSITILTGDITDTSSLIRTVKLTQPTEFYNLAAQSFVHDSFLEPISTGDITGLGVARALEAIYHVNPKTRFYQASSSEMFGNANITPQNETTLFHPRSPYAVAKVFGHHITINYRESYNMFGCSGILFNHESPRRGLEFVTRKITNGVARIKFGIDKKIMLGNLDARRDWGFAGDYVKAMWLMLQQEKPDDFVIGTGVSHSIKDFAKAAFKTVGINDWESHVTIDERFMRPAEVHTLCADPSKAKNILKWQTTVDFDELVKMMMNHDLKLVEESLHQMGTVAD